ncbi:MAG: ATP-binding protein [Candidatus Firestonebacteria bacterium]
MDKNKIKILIVDDESLIRELYKRVLEKINIDFDEADSFEKTIQFIKLNYYNIVILDLKLADTDGITLLKEIKRLCFGCEVIVVTGYASLDSSVAAIRAGAYDYITKPIDVDEFSLTINRCIDKQILSKEVGRLKSTVGLYELSKAMTSIMDLQDLLNTMVRIVKQTLVSDTCSVMLMDEATSKLKIMASDGLSDEVINSTELKVGESIAGWVLKEQKPTLLFNGLKKYPQFAHLNPRPEIYSAISVPLIVKDKVIGVVNVSSKDESRNFTTEDMELLAIFASDTALMIENARIHEKLTKYIKMLEESQIKMKELDRLKSEFISNVSHELRTPLTAIKGAVELIMGEIISTAGVTVEKLLNIARNNCDRLTNLISDLLDSVRIEAGKMELNMGKVSLQSIISELNDEFKFLAGHKNLTFAYSGPKSIEDIKGDSERIKQVLNNLLTNAIKFTASGGTITITLEDRNNDVRISVTDTGVGVSPESYDKIFERFHQVDGGLTRQAGGLGLGLFIAKSIVESHDGKIGVESTLGKGSTFFFTLPKHNFVLK